MRKPFGGGRPNTGRQASMSQSTVRSADPGSAPDLRAERLDLLDCLASQALTWVAQHVRSTLVDVDVRASERLRAAAIGPDRRACSDVAHELIAGGLTAERICDVCIPDTIRRMGDEWVSGDLPFSIVTIGSARLQGLLRELDHEFVSRPAHVAGTAGAILLVVPAGADHTLGPLVLASQLRRKGFSVRLSLGETIEAVADAARRTRFDAVFLSATIARSVPHLARSATAIRAAAPVAPPVVLGGAIVQQGGLTQGRVGGTTSEVADSIDLSAIDHVTCDIEEAMRLCGLNLAK